MIVAIKCPRCGSIHLTTFYDQRTDQGYVRCINCKARQAVSPNDYGATVLQEFRQGRGVLDSLNTKISTPLGGKAKPS